MKKSLIALAMVAAVLLGWVAGDVLGVMRGSMVAVAGGIGFGFLAVAAGKR